MLYFLLPFFFSRKLVCVNQTANPHTILNFQWTWTRPILLVRECSQNRNFGFLSGGLLWTCLYEVFGADLGGLICSGVPGGTFLDWDNVGCHPGAQCMHSARGWNLLTCSFSGVLCSLPWFICHFVPKVWMVGRSFFNNLGYCCNLGWLLNPVVTTRSLVTVCVHWICLGSGFFLLSNLIFSLQINFLLWSCFFQ